MREQLPALRSLGFHIVDTKAYLTGGDVFRELGSITQLTTLRLHLSNTQVSLM
jgi:hypothetical protein